MGFHHVDQAGFELRISGDPPTLASQSSGITGVNHCAWPIAAILNEKLKITSSRNRKTSSPDTSFLYILEAFLYFYPLP